MRVAEDAMRKASRLLLDLAAASVGSWSLGDDEAARVASELASDPELALPFVRLAGAVGACFVGLVAQVSEGVDSADALQLLDAAIEKLIAQAERA